MLIQNYEYGGLKMVDVLLKQKALICSWYNKMQLILKKTDHIPKWCNIPSWLLDYFEKNMCRAQTSYLVTYITKLQNYKLKWFYLSETFQH